MFSIGTPWAPLVGASSLMASAVPTATVKLQVSDHGLWAHSQAVLASLTCQVWLLFLEAHHVARLYLKTCRHLNASPAS